MTLQHALILAGGASSRMGQDKALLDIAGQSLLQRMLELVAAAGLQATVVGREATADDNWLGIADEHPGQGPLAGLATGLRVVQQDACLLAVDLPLLRLEDLHWLLQQAQGEHGMMPHNGSGLEPCCAIYKAACLPLIDAVLVSGKRSLHALCAAGDFSQPLIPPNRQDSFINCNTPDDVQRIRAHLKDTP